MVCFLNSLACVCCVFPAHGSHDTVKKQNGFLVAVSSTFLSYSSTPFILLSQKRLEIGCLVFFRVEIMIPYVYTYRYMIP